MTAAVVVVAVLVGLAGFGAVAWIAWGQDVAAWLLGRRELR